MRRLIALAVVVSLGLSAAAFAEGGRKPGGDKKRNPEEIFKRLDKNGDGKLSLDEFKARPGGKGNGDKAGEIFKRLDKDSDGFLTLDEIKSGRRKKDKK